MMIKAVATATTACGVTVAASGPSSKTASNVDVNGNRSIAAHIAPMPLAIAGARLAPGNALIAMPMAAPMKIEGKTGPPRNALSESAYAKPLQSRTKIIKPTEYSVACPTKLGNASWPENSTSLKLRPEMSWYAMAIRPMSRPNAAVTSTRLMCTIGRSRSASERISHPKPAPIAPMTTAHAKDGNVGSVSGGTDCRASEKVPRPVQLPSPTKTNAPIPEASRPGSTTG